MDKEYQQRNKIFFLKKHMKTLELKKEIAKKFLIH